MVAESHVLNPLLLWLKMAVWYEKFVRAKKIITNAYIPWFPTLLDWGTDNFILLLGLVLLLVATPTELLVVSDVAVKLESFVKISAWSSWRRFFEACFWDRVSCKTCESLPAISSVKSPPFSISLIVLSCLDGGKPPAVILSEEANIIMAIIIEQYLKY